MQRLIPAFLFTLAICFPSSTAASSQICDQAARYAATRTNTPAKILLALTRVETGRTRNGRFEPWPWTVNMQGKGVWFDSKADALAYAQRHLNQGARSFDMGCFQVNYRWHHEAFSSLNAMMSPQENTIYAAQFISSLYQETGSWSRAAGLYHSRTPSLSQKYERRFKKIYAQLEPSVVVAQAPSTRSNRFPLLQRTDQSLSGPSLVPFNTPQSRPLFSGRGAND